VRAHRCPVPWPRTSGTRQGCSRNTPWPCGAVAELSAFRYATTGTETYFVNRIDPSARSREVFTFHRPETLAAWMRYADEHPDAPTFRAALRTSMPLLETHGLRMAQVEAITGLEASLAVDKPRALIQMATGAGKTFTAVTDTYRLLRNAGARRVLFLVDRNNLAARPTRSSTSTARRMRTGRANALLKVTFKALRRVSLDSASITRIARAALVLLQLEHGPAYPPCACPKCRTPR
jgi:hypothetical protein